MIFDDLTTFRDYFCLLSDAYSKDNGSIQTDTFNGNIVEFNEMRRIQKRKFAFGGGEKDGEEVKIDKEFLDADRKILVKLREEQYPSHTRNSVLCKPSSVCVFDYGVHNAYSNLFLVFCVIRISTSQ